MIDKFNLIQQGESIGFALSGGIDSITLLYILNYLKKFSSMDFKLTAVHIKTANYKTDILQKFCADLNVAYMEAQIDINNFQKNVCYYCSKNKRIKIKELLANRGIKKVIFAHNKNDVLETFLMNLTIHKRIETIQPISCSNDFCVIRPMLDLEKNLIVRLFNYFQLPLLDYNCSHQITNKRQDIRSWIEKENSDVVSKMLENITKAFYINKN